MQYEPVLSLFLFHTRGSVLGGNYSSPTSFKTEMDKLQ